MRRKGERKITTEELLSILPTGRLNGRSMKESAAVLGVDERTFRALVLKACKEGCLICGDDNGYYIPQDMDEVSAYYQLVQSRQRSTAIRLAPFRRKIKEYGA